MLLIIHNLPSNTRYADIKAMIKQKCGLTEMIVDNLVPEGKAKKVTVGLAHEGDAELVTRKINGMYVNNHQLYVEDVRQKKTNEQPYRPSNQYQQEQYNQPSYYGPPNTAEFQPQPPMMPMENQLPSGPTAPNFGVPFYMTAQNQKNVGNNPPFMVQYPTAQGSMGNEPNKGRDMGFNKQNDGRKRDRSVSPDHGQRREYSPKRQSRWNDSHYDKSESRRGHNRPSQYEDGHGVDFSKDKSYRDSYQNRPSQDFGSRQSNNNRFEEPSLSEPFWERPNCSTFNEQNDSYHFKDNRNMNAQNYRHNQDRKPQTFRENNYSQSRDSNYESRSSDFPKKRSYESLGKTKYSPQIKKFGSNQQFDLQNQQRASGSSFSNSYQNKKNTYINKPSAPPSIQQSRPHEYPKMQQKNKPQWKPNNQPMQNVTKQTNTFKGRAAPSKVSQPTEEMLARHKAWRIQAASLIATQILNKVGRSRNKRDPFIIKLKAHLRARIDLMAGDNTSLTLKDLLFRYRNMFHDDITFYNSVLAKPDNDEEDQVEAGIKGVNKPREITPKVQFIGKPPAAVPTPGNTQRLPKYPDGNKKVLSQMKQAQKDELLNESLYTLDADHEKALKEELDKVDQLVKQVLKNCQSETEKSISKFMNDSFVPDLRKILNLHVKKRILDVRTSLTVRVICQYKAPKREFLDAFLKDYGVVSLKAFDKNRKVLVAICDTYENFDALCMKQSAVIDNLKVSFKPLNLTGPPIKSRNKKQHSTVSDKAQVEIKNDRDGEVETVEINSDNENKKVTDDGQSETKEMKNENCSSDVQENQTNENNECKVTPPIKVEEVILIEDNDIKTEDVILVEEEGNKITSDEKVTDLEAASNVDKNSDPTIGNDTESAGNIESNKTVDETVAVDVQDKSDSKIMIQEQPEKLDNDNIADSTVMTQKQPEILDNDNIAEDDLEDF